MRDLGEASHSALSTPCLPQASVVHPDVKTGHLGVRKLNCSRAEGLKHKMILLYGMLQLQHVFSENSDGRWKSCPCLTADGS